MLKYFTHGSMNTGKGPKRTTSGSAGKKTTYLDEINHTVASVLPKEDDSSRVLKQQPSPYSIQNFYYHKFIQPQDVWITNPATRWLHHTVGFPFFYHYKFQGSCLRTVIQPLAETAGLLISWVFFFFSTNHTNLNGSTRGGLLSDHPHGQNHSYSQSTDWR